MSTRNPAGPQKANKMKKQQVFKYKPFDRSQDAMFHSERFKKNPVPVWGRREPCPKPAAVPDAAVREGIYVVRVEGLKREWGKPSFAYVYLDGLWYEYTDTTGEYPAPHDPGIRTLDALNKTPDKYLTQAAKELRRYWYYERYFANRYRLNNIEAQKRFDFIKPRVSNIGKPKGKKSGVVTTESDNS